MEKITVRRHLEQVKHCVEEALSVVESGEDLECAIADANQAFDLLRLAIIPRLKKGDL